MIPALRIRRARYRWRRLPADERLMLFTVALVASAYIGALAACVVLILEYGI